MWFEIIPSFMIIVVAMALPHYAARGLNWLLVGNLYRRQLISESESRNYLRDSRLVGHPYKILGLDSLFKDEQVQDKGEDEECYDDDDDSNNNNKKTDGGKDD